MKGKDAEDQKKIFEEIFHIYYGKLTYYAFTLTKDQAIAADIVQAVFIRIWGKRETLDISGAFENYLYRATYNLCMNNIRNAKVRSRYAKQAMNNIMHTNNAGHKIMEQELAVHINKIMERLPPQCKLIFHKSRMEGKKYAEIALELGISIKTVEAQIGKALTIFRNELKDYLVVTLLIVSIGHNIFPLH